MSAVYEAFGKQRIRIDKCPDCGHTGHDDEPCPTLTSTMNMVTGEQSERVQCLCKHPA